MPVERVHADPRVKADVGRVALQRGPVVFCLEGVDNDGHVRNLCLPQKSPLSATFEKDLLGGVVTVHGQAQAVSRTEPDKLGTTEVKFQAIPYCTWDNRKAGPMVVWLPEKPELAEIAGEEGAVQSNGVGVTASHVNPSDTLEELNDGATPQSSKDHAIRRMTWWDHKGTAEWLSYRFARPQPVAEASVYWFDDTGSGGCRVPAEWRLLYRDGDDWKPARLTQGSSYGTAVDRFNRVTFEPVTTREVRLEVKLQSGFSGGVLKWKVSGAK
jgi:hypothetical protein